MSELTEIRGIGPKTITLLKKLNITNVEELVTHYPFRYEILRRCDLNEMNEGDKISIDGKIESIPILFHFRGGLNKLNFRLVTNTGVVGVSIFNRAFMKPNLRIGSLITIIGKYEKSKNIIIASDIKFSGLSSDIKLEPVYHTTSGLTNKVLSNYINLGVLKSDKILDKIPDYLIDKHKFFNKKTAINIIHNPPTNAKLIEASTRLKYEELFEFMFKINYLKEYNIENNVGIKRLIDTNKVKDFINNLPFTLTNDQLKAVKEITKDLENNLRMNRMLQGDVGCGKTIVGFIAMYINYLSGYQSALMVPTEILASQHFNSIKTFFKDHDINIELLVGSMKKSEKLKIYNALKSGDIDMIIGTHALIQENVIYNNLGLVITDEQHRFGVNQRSNLKNKGIKPDVLYMSATPIPRTYALTIYGDMDISIIKEMPKGRISTETVIKTSKELPEILKLMEKELLKNHQIYVIAPLIEENELSDLTTVNELKDKMDVIFGKKYNIDIIHGKMTSVNKESIMSEFIQNKINILISTTVVEVGVDVLNATMIIIFDAERFGLSTLHQLRGRVGRSNLPSTCILISDSDTKRLKIMEETLDGFVISEEDFKLRGHGDLFGTKQSGDMEFKIANLKQDYNILLKAKDESKEYLLNKKYDNDTIKKYLIESIHLD